MYRAFGIARDQNRINKMVAVLRIRSEGSARSRVGRELVILRSSELRNKRTEPNVR
jgi:hypothetical protein